MIIPTSCKLLFGQSVDLLSCLVFAWPYSYSLPEGPMPALEGQLSRLVQLEESSQLKIDILKKSWANLNHNPLPLNKHCNVHSTWVECYESFWGKLLCPILGRKPPPPLPPPPPAPARQIGLTRRDSSGKYPACRKPLCFLHCFQFLHQQRWNAHDTSRSSCQVFLQTGYECSNSSTQ